MKGSTAQIVLKSLSGQQLGSFFASLEREANGDMLVKICQYLIASDTGSESEVTEHFRFTRGQYNPKFALICQRLSTFLVTDKESLRARHALELSRDLVRAGQYEATIDLVRSSLRQASPVEDLDLMADLCDVLDRLPESMVPDKIEQVRIRAQHQNLATYAFLFAHLKQVAQEMNPASSRKAIDETLAHPAMANPECALSKKAAYLYWQIRSLIHSVLREHLLAVECQGNAIGLLRDHHWMASDYEFSLAKQTRLLAEQLRVAGQMERYQQVFDEFFAMQLSSIPAQQERLYLQFPFELAIALYSSGDKEKTRSLAYEFIKLVGRPEFTFPTEFVTKNLYLCLYAAIATANSALWTDAIALLARFSKTEFRHLYYPLYRFLEVIHAIDIQDWDDAYRLAKNLRKTDATELVHGMNQALAYLMPPVYAMVYRPSAPFTEMLTAGWDAAKETLQGSVLCEYFDLTAWYEGRVGGCTMIEIFGHRAAS